LGTTPLKISSEVTFDPRYGFQTREVYSGPQESLATLNATLMLRHYRGETFLMGFPTSAPALSFHFALTPPLRGFGTQRTQNQGDLFGAERLQLSRF